MNLVLFAFVQLLLVQYTYSGVVKNVLDVVTGEAHSGSDNYEGFVSNKHDSHGVSATKENGNVLQNIVDSFKETVESVNDHVKKLFSTDEQRSSREACTHTRHGEASNWPRHSHHKKSRPVTHENNFKNSYENDKDGTEYDSAEKLSKSTYEYYSDTDARNNEDSWSSNNKHYDVSTISYTISISSVYNNGQDKATLGTNVVFDYNDKNIANQNEDTGVSNTHNSASNNELIAIEDNVTGRDKIVFPGKVNVSTPKTCPEGLVIAANGDCLEPIVIHMGNRTSTGSDRGVARSVFVGGCLKGYSRSVDGKCVETIYD